MIVLSALPRHSLAATLLYSFRLLSVVILIDRVLTRTPCLTRSASQQDPIPGYNRPQDPLEEERNFLTGLQRLTLVHEDHGEGSYFHLKSGAEAPQAEAVEKQKPDRGKGKALDEAGAKVGQRKKYSPEGSGDDKGHGQGKTPPDSDASSSETKKVKGE